MIIIKNMAEFFHFLDIEELKQTIPTQLLLEVFVQNNTTIGPVMNIC